MSLQGTLTISDIGLHHAGTYVCSANSMAGADTHEVEVYVQGATNTLNHISFANVVYAKCLMYIT